MQKNFRYNLRKGSKHDICPNCGKKEFKPYVDSNGNVVGEQYGRCERVMSCGYLKYPKSYKNDDWTPPPPPPPPPPTEYISEDIVEATMTEYDSNYFYLYLVSLFGDDIANELIHKYNIGTATNGGTIFWQKDKDGRYRTGKVIYYGSNGKRKKDRKSWFVHSKIKENFPFKQCFFGIHLDDGTMPTALCESEKTAVIMSVLMPEYIWLATGGSEMINLDRLIELKRLDKIFPDGGQREKWEQKTRTFPNRQIDYSVELAIMRGDIEQGSDILDLIQFEYARDNKQDK
jgi:hypothetical protein